LALGDSHYTSDSQTAYVLIAKGLDNSLDLPMERHASTEDGKGVLLLGWGHHTNTQLHSRLAKRPSSFLPPLSKYCTVPYLTSMKHTIVNLMRRRTVVTTTASQPRQPAIKVTYSVHNHTWRVAANCSYAANAYLSCGQKRTSQEANISWGERVFIVAIFSNGISACFVYLFVSLRLPSLARCPVHRKSR